METLKELWDSVRLNLLDRLGNPLIGAFFVAWLIWNFRILLIAFGEGEWKPKIDYIDKVLMPNWLDWLVHGYVVPLGFAIAWVFLLPIVFREVLVFHRSQVAKTARAVMIADERVPISHEEATKLRLRLREMTAEWEQERATYLRQNEELSERIGTLQKLLPPAAGSPSQAPETISSNEPNPQGADERPLELPDPLVSYVGQFERDQSGKSQWPRGLGQKDLEQLPSSVAVKVRQHKFELRDIQALLAMRNWSASDSTKLARALGIEKFDAQVTIDRLRDLSLIGRGSQGDTLNADGRMLTSYFKRSFSPPAGASDSPNGNA